MDFPGNKFEIKTVVTKKNFSSVSDLLFGSYVIHNSHVTREMSVYAHGFCNKNLRETQNLIPVFAQKGIRLCVWQTKQLNIGGANLTNVQYGNIGSQVKFIDTMKYYQRSLSSLAKSAYENEIASIRNSCQKFIEGNAMYSTAFNSLSDQDKMWVLDYLSGRKGVIHYKLIRPQEDLDTKHEGEFFSRT